MESDVGELLANYMNEEGASDFQVNSKDALLKRVLSGQLTILDLVLKLGDYLTSEEDTVRTRGSMLLGEIVGGLSSVHLPSETLHTLNEFFSSRLADWPALKGALTGCINIVRRPAKLGSLAGNDVVCMLKSVLKEVHVQSLTVANRMLALELLERILDTFPAASSSMGSDLVNGAIQSIDGERDPRCLLLAFRIVYQLGQLFPPDAHKAENPLQQAAEDLFDTVSCYFPLTFNPPPGEDRGIMQEDLAAALEAALTCTPLFAPFAVPLCLEKLSSSLSTAKKSSLQYLSACASTFGAQAFEDQVPALWVALKKEILPPPVSESSDEGDAPELAFSSEAKSCLKDVVRVLSEPGAGSAHPASASPIPRPSAILEAILRDECVDFLFTIAEDEMRVFGSGSWDASSNSAMDVDDRENEEPNSEQESAAPSSGLLAKEKQQGDWWLGAQESESRERALACGQLLAAVAECGPSACATVCTAVLPRLLQILSGAQDEDGRSRSSDAGPSVEEAGEGREIALPTSSVVALASAVRLLAAAKDVACVQAQDGSRKKSRAGVGEGASTLVSRSLVEQARRCFVGIWAGLQQTRGGVPGGKAGLVGRARQLAKVSLVGAGTLASFPREALLVPPEAVKGLVRLLVEALLGEEREEEVREEALRVLLVVNTAEQLNDGGEEDAERGDLGEGCVGESAIVDVAVPMLIAAARGTVSAKEDCGGLSSLTLAAGREGVQTLRRALQGLAALGAKRPTVRLRVLRFLRGLARELVGGAVRSSGDGVGESQEQGEGGSSRGVSGGGVLVLERLRDEILPHLRPGGAEEVEGTTLALDLLALASDAWVAMREIPEEMLPAFEGTIKAAVRQCAAPNQREVLHKVFSIPGPMVPHGSSAIGGSVGPMPALFGQADLALITDVGALRRWEQQLCCAAAVIIALRPEVSTELQTEQVIKLFVHACKMCARAADMSAMALASLVNKWSQPEATPRPGGAGVEQGVASPEPLSLDKALDLAIDQELWPAVEGAKLGPDLSRAEGLGEDGAGWGKRPRQQAVVCVKAMAWLGKALAMRGHSRTSAVAGSLVLLLCSGQARGGPEGMEIDEEKREGIPEARPEVPVVEGGVRAQTIGKPGVRVAESAAESDADLAGAAAEGVGMVLVESDMCLSSELHAHARPLYRQRFFTAMLAPLIEALRAYRDSQSRHWLYTAIASMVAQVPASVLLTESSRTFPLVLEALEVLTPNPSSGKAIVACLLALSVFLTDSDKGAEVAAEHANAVVRRLLPLVSYKPSMAVRQTALQCLLTATTLPFHLLYPLRFEVFEVVTAALDDKKRSVRAEAVRCRRAWSLLAPNSSQ